MTTHRRQQRQAGFTRPDLLVTVLVLCLAVGVLLPCVQAARTDAARAQCQQNLRTMGQGFLAFEKVNGGFPPRRTGMNNGSPYSGWGPHLLSHIGEDTLAQKYNTKLDFFDPGNKAAVETIVKTFRCPAAPTDDRIVGIQSQASTKSENPDKDTLLSVQAVATDYISSNGVLMPDSGYWLNARTRGIGNGSQAMIDNEVAPLTRITDGLSCTLLVIEQAGRPAVWRNGKKKEGLGQFGMSPNARGAWAGWGSIAFGPAIAETGETRGKGDSTDCTVNCNNWFGIYAFHAEGGAVLMCDGSVRFVGRRLDPLTFAYLTLCDDGQLVFPEDY